MGSADLHIHTRVSDGLATIEQVLEYIEQRTGLDVVAITDHEDATGGLRARELAARRGYRFEVIAGAEVTTLHGHLIALFIESTPPSFRRVESTLDMIHRQEGLAIVPHPMSWLTRSISERTLDRVSEAASSGTNFDGIETANPSPAGGVTRKRALAGNAARWLLPATGGSDAHHLAHIGTGWTDFEGTSATDLRRALEAKSTTGQMTRYPALREIGYGNAMLGLAWGYAATPRKILAQARARRRGRGPA